MKHTHAFIPGRPNHQERAQTANRLTRLIRVVMKPIRLRRLAVEADRADDEFSDVVALIEICQAALPMLQRRRVQIAAKRMLVERGLA